MNLVNLLSNLRFDDEFMNNVAVWERIPARPARYAEFPPGLDKRLVDLVRNLNMSPLYTHQVEAIESAQNGSNTVLVTGTASGKSLAYHLPALQNALQNPASTALYLFPTKALAQDQASSLSHLIDTLQPPHPIGCQVYDGDTPSGQRTKIRRSGGIVISNPDMLHVGILPYHARWAGFFQNLRLVVIDEIHTFRGIFGSHMANVIRRLKRICEFHGSHPLFICTSATIANPKELAERLLEAPVNLIEEDGSPSGEKHIILYNPPTVNKSLGIRRSYTLEARRLAGRFLQSGTQTIVFARARLTTEILLSYLKDEVIAGGGNPQTIRGYRGGYLPLERREIEMGLREGTVNGVVATNALELGVDIGALGAAVLAGYPGTIASTWQQFGRAGRRANVSVGIMVASGAPLDQYIVLHPRYLFENTPEHALINPDNLMIIINHLKCAAYELPFKSGESFGLFNDAEMILQMLTKTGEIHHSGGQYRWIDDSYPAADISLRTGTQDVIVIQQHTENGPQVIGEVDRQGAHIMVYEGAVYMHEGAQYLVESIDWNQGLAIIGHTELDYYTRAATSTDIDIEEIAESVHNPVCTRSFGRVLITSRATGYRVIKRYTHETLGFGKIDLPPQQFETAAYWFSLTPAITAELEQANIIASPADYGPNWDKQRSAARERDQYRCRQCNAPEAGGRTHHVHHLRPLREFAYIPGENENYREANKLSNLITLCASCHAEVEASQRKLSVMSGMSNVLRNLSPLLLMCAPTDIGIHSELRSADTGAPTVTIYDHAAGGLGLSARLYDLHDDLLQGAFELVRDCPCAVGCPACVGPVGEVEAGTKTATRLMLAALLRQNQD